MTWVSKEGEQVIALAMDAKAGEAWLDIRIDKDGSTVGYLVGKENGDQEWIEKRVFESMFVEKKK